MGNVIPGTLYQILRAALEAGKSGEMTLYFSDRRVTSYRLVESGKIPREEEMLDKERQTV